MAGVKSNDEPMPLRIESARMKCQNSVGKKDEERVR
jgi:hypothetical protein